MRRTLTPTGSSKRSVSLRVWAATRAMRSPAARSSISTLRLYDTHAMLPPAISTSTKNSVEM
jgi:hypothetical protein